VGGRGGEAEVADVEPKRKDSKTCFIFFGFLTYRTKHCGPCPRTAREKQRQTEQQPPTPPPTTTTQQQSKTIIQNNLLIIRARSKEDIISPYFSNKIYFIRRK